jgi:hypothetical protein
MVIPSRRSRCRKCSLPATEYLHAPADRSLRTLFQGTAAVILLRLFSPSRAASRSTNRQQLPGTADRHRSALRVTADNKTTRARVRSPARELTIPRSFNSLACWLKIRSPSEHTFSVVVRSVAQGSLGLETSTGTASRIRFSSLPDPTGM